METKRNGNFIDEFGACKVCDGEIPYGHTDNCDIWKLEKEIKEVQRNWLGDKYAAIPSFSEAVTARMHDELETIERLEKENREIQSNYDILLKERGELIDYLKSLDYPPAQQVLVGPIELVKHIVNHLIRSQDLAVEDMKGAMERNE